MTTWNKAAEQVSKGKPIFLVGAGFPLAIAKMNSASLPSTANLISDTATNHANDFPLIKAFHHEFSDTDTRLDSVWTLLDKVCKQGLKGGSTYLSASTSLLDAAKDGYESFDSDNPMQTLFDGQYRRIDISQFPRVRFPLSPNLSCGSALTEPSGATAHRGR